MWESKNFSFVRTDDVEASLNTNIALHLDTVRLNFDVQRLYT